MITIEPSKTVRLPFKRLIMIGCLLSAMTAAAEPSFLITPDPNFVLVDLRYHGGRTGSNSAYTLYADGRLVAKRVHHQGAVTATKEYQVEAADLDAFIQGLVDAGLYDSNQQQLEHKMGPRRRTLTVEDSPTMRVTMALQRYQRRESTEPQEVEVTFESLHPFFIARHFENVEEVQCLDQIARWFAPYRPRIHERSHGMTGLDFLAVSRPASPWTD